MKKTMHKILSLLLCVVFVVGVLPLTASAKTITEYSQGDIIEFGWYPQSKVKDSTITAQLNAKARGNWTSYGYYSGTGTFDDGQMTAKDYMHYVDITLNGNKYRGVEFTAYRPYSTDFTSSTDHSYQDNNGYGTNMVYWFKFDPLQWRVLDPATGLVLCENIIDSQAYNNYVLSGTDAYGNFAFWGDAGKTHYANNYAKSSIRRWLNNDFYNTAFSTAQQDIIQTTALENKAYNFHYDSASTNDKIFFLSYSDVLDTSYGFSSDSTHDINRRTSGSDYAKCQGLYVAISTSSDDLDAEGNKCSDWWLRSAGYYSNTASYVNGGGGADRYFGTNSNYTNVGVRPAFKLNLTSDIFQSDIMQVGCHHIYKGEVTAPTCNAEGYTTFTCTVCGFTCQGNKTAKLPHSYNSIILKEATCSETGTKKYTCSVCEDTYTETITKLPHTYNAVVTPPTCTQSGYTTYTCSVCNYSYTGDTTAKVAHTYNSTVVTKPTKYAQGYTTHTCTVCGDSYKDTYTNPPATFYLECGSNMPGQDVTVTIKVKDNPGLIGTKLSLQYDRSVLTLKSVSCGSLFGSAYFTPGENLNANPYSLVFMDALAVTNHTGNTTLATLTFHINAGATIGSSTAISLSYDKDSTFDTTLGKLLFNTTGGSVYVKDYPMGDVNGDGKVNLKDVVTLTRYLSDPNSASILRSKSDVNKDGTVSLIDAALIRRYLAGWKVTLG